MGRESFPEREYSMNKGEGKELADCTRSYMPFGAAETKGDIEVSKRKA